MSKRILGPAGSHGLPPAGFEDGARVCRVDWAAADEANGWRATMGRLRCRAALDDSEVTIIWDGAHSVCREPIDKVALDLTTGGLDAACRTLLALVVPAVEQPLCAPLWMRMKGGWSLRWINEQGVQGGFAFTPETHPEIAIELRHRQSIALALHAEVAKATS